MTDAEPKDLTQLLRRAAAGDDDAANHAFAAMLGELRQIARRYVASAGKAPSFEADDLIGGAVAKLAAASRIEWANRGHFLAVMSVAMRQYMIDRIRSKRTAKSGNGKPPLSLDRTGFDIGIRTENTLVQDVHESLEKLARAHPRTAQIVELTHFLDLTAEEVAAATGSAPRTVVRELKFGRAYLRKELER